MSRFALALAAVLLSGIFGAAAAAERESLPKQDIPPAVAAEIECGTEPDFVTRRPLAGGYLFAWQCASNRANYINAFVYARSPAGGGAKLIRFPAPDGKPPLEELSNAEIESDTITHLFVDPEDGKICRTEARWSLANGPLQPELVFWRETRDCEGKHSWRVRVNKAK